MTLPQEFAEGVEPGLRESLRLLDLPAAWLLVLVILPAFAFVAWLGYAKESIGPVLRSVLLALRLSAFVLLLIVLARPVMVERREEVHPAEIVLLLDDSASMRRQDAYGGDAENARILERLSGLDPTQASRLDLAKSVVQRELVPHLERGSYALKLYSFAESATPLSNLDSLSGRGPVTHLGDSLLQVLSASRGRYVTDVIVVSDGRSNGGLLPVEAARSAGAAGIPVHALIVGDTRPEKNAVVELVEAPSEALEGDELAVTVRVHGRGTEPGSSAHVMLEEIEDEDASTRPVAEEEVQLSEEGERVVLIAPRSETGLRTGERRFRVSIQPLEGETMVDDNLIEFGVHVSPARMRVLFVEGYPRWEYRFVKNLLLRADKNIDVQCYLLSATRDFPQEASRNLESLTAVPATREELLDNYDVVILGDVDPFGLSPDPARCESFLRGLREFVEAGGGLLFQAGEYHNPRAFANTALEDVLPIVLDPTNVLTFQGDTRTEFRPALEDPLNPHEILRLHPDPETNRRLWEDGDEGLRGFFWYSPVQKVKSGAQVLLHHPTDTNLQTGEPNPLLVLGYFPAGRTMYLAVDSTYRWRYHYGDRYLDTFWRNAIRWLALGRLKSGDRRYRIETSRSTYDLEDRVLVESRILDEDFRPSEQPTQKVFWSGPEGGVHELELARETERPGVYRGGLQVDRPGLYRVWIEAETRRVSSSEFEVVLPSRENADPSPDPETLRSLAAKTGGIACDLARSSRLLDQFPGGEERREPISSRLEDAWDHWGTLLLALGLLSAEWILRKRAELL